MSPTIKLQNFYKKPGDGGIDSMEIERKETPIRLMPQEKKADNKNNSSQEENFKSVLDKVFEEEEKKIEVLKSSKTIDDILNEELLKDEKNEEALNEDKSEEILKEEKNEETIKEPKKEEVLENENKEPKEEENISENKEEKELTKEEIEEEKKREEHIINMLKSEMNEEKKEEKEAPLQPLRLGRDGTPNINSGNLQPNVPPRRIAPQGNNIAPIPSLRIPQESAVENLNIEKTLNNAPISLEREGNGINIPNTKQNENLAPKNEELRPISLQPQVSQQIPGESIRPTIQERPLPLGGGRANVGQPMPQRTFPPNQGNSQVGQPIRLRGNTDNNSEQIERKEDRPFGSNSGNIDNIPKQPIRPKFSPDKEAGDNPEVLKAMGGFSQNEGGTAPKEPGQINVPKREDDKIGRVLDSEKKVRNGWSIGTWILVIILFLPTLSLLGNNFLTATKNFFQTSSSVSNMMIFMSGILSILSFIILLFAPLGKMRSPLSFLINRFGLLGEELKKNENKRSVYMDMFINAIYILFILASYIFFVKGYIDPKNGFTTMFNASIRIFIAYAVVWISTLVIVQILSSDKSEAKEKDKVLKRNIYALLLIGGIVAVLMFYPYVIDNVVGWFYQNETLAKIFDFLGYERGTSITDLSLKK